MAKMSLSEKQFKEISEKGITYKQEIDQKEMINKIMVKGWRKEKKIWWFAYELMGFHTLKVGLVEREYFMSYKASTRVSEMAKDGAVISRKTEGKMHVYALYDLA